jgi:hypothetical protein
MNAANHFIIIIINPILTITIREEKEDKTTPRSNILVDIVIISIVMTIKITLLPTSTSSIFII